MIFVDENLSAGDLTLCLSLTGRTRLTKYPAVRLYQQIDARSSLLARLYDGMCKFEKVNTFKNLDDEIRFFSYFNTLLNMMRYVEECHGQLDITNTIDQTPLGDLSYARYPAKDDVIFIHRVDAFTPLTTHWKKYMEDFPSTLLEKMYSPYVRISEGVFDKAAQLLMKATYKSRQSTFCARLQWELKVRHEQGWYLVFDTLTFANDRRSTFENAPNALRDYFRDIGRSVLQAEGRPKGDSFNDCYSYFCVPEYGSERGRLHFHCVHFCRTLPVGSVDPNIGCRRRNRRQINSFKGHWKYGHSMPIALRYHNDAFTKRGWLWPLKDDGMPYESRPVVAIGYYVCKYVSKNIDRMESDSKRAQVSKHGDVDFIQAKSVVDDVDLSDVQPKTERKVCKTYAMSAERRKMFRVRMSRNLGQCSIPMQDLSLNAVTELARIHYSVSPYSRIVKRTAMKELVSRMRGLSLREIQQYALPPTNLLNTLRCMMRNTKESSPPNFTYTGIPPLGVEGISDEARRFLESHQLDIAALKNSRQGSNFCGRPK